MLAVCGLVTGLREGAAPGHVAGLTSYRCQDPEVALSGETTPGGRTSGTPGGLFRGLQGGADQRFSIGRRLRACAGSTPRCPTLEATKPLRTPNERALTAAADRISAAGASPESRTRPAPGGSGPGWQACDVVACRVSAVAEGASFPHVLRQSTAGTLEAITPGRRTRARVQHSAGPVRWRSGRSQDGARVDGDGPFPCVQRVATDGRTRFESGRPGPVALRMRARPAGRCPTGAGSLLPPHTSGVLVRHDGVAPSPLLSRIDSGPLTIPRTGRPSETRGLRVTWLAGCPSPRRIACSKGIWCPSWRRCLHAAPRVGDQPPGVQGHPGTLGQGSRTQLRALCRPLGDVGDAAPVFHKAASLPTSQSRTPVGSAAGGAAPFRDLQDGQDPGSHSRPTDNDAREALPTPTCSSLEATTSPEVATSSSLWPAIDGTAVAGPFFPVCTDARTAAPSATGVSAGRLVSVEPGITESCMSSVRNSPRASTFSPSGARRFQGPAGTDLFSPPTWGSDQAAEDWHRQREDEQELEEMREEQAES